MVRAGSSTSSELWGAAPGERVHAGSPWAAARWASGTAPAESPPVLRGRSLVRAGQDPAHRNHGRGARAHLLAVAPGELALTSGDRATRRERRAISMGDNDNDNVRTGAAAQSARGVGGGDPCRTSGPPASGRSRRSF